MSREKIITSLIISIFFIVFSIFNFEEYYNFHKEKIEINKNKIELESKIKNFDLKNIENIEEIKFYYTPSKDLLNKKVEKKNNSKNYVYIEVYKNNKKRIKEAVIKAKKRWVDVKIILEKDPYMAYTINDKTYNELQKNNIEVIWSNTENYALNHSKMILIDDLNIVSTWNLTYSTFTQNRDFFLFIKDKNTNKLLKEIFYNDFNWIKFSPYSENLVLSPSYSRNKIIDLIESAEKDIKIYIQYFNDEEINNKLIEIKKIKNIKISAIIPDTATQDENTKKLIKSGIEIKKIPKYKMHAKAILVDEKYLFIWSENFSSYSLDKNREIWFIIKNNEVISDFLDIFNYDFK